VASQIALTLKERAAAIPGITSIALTSSVPLNQDAIDQMTIVPEGFGT
jgi:hypothetical protein